MVADRLQSFRAAKNRAVWIVCIFLFHKVVKGLWAYLKEHKLQDPENRQFFTPDKMLEPIFGKEKIKAFGMTKYLKGHLTDDSK